MLRATPPAGRGGGRRRSASGGRGGRRPCAHAAPRSPPAAPAPARKPCRMVIRTEEAPGPLGRRVGMRCGDAACRVEARLLPRLPPNSGTLFAIAVAKGVTVCNGRPSGLVPSGHRDVMKSVAWLFESFTDRDTGSHRWAGTDALTASSVAAGYSSETHTCQ